MPNKNKVVIPQDALLAFIEFVRIATQDTNELQQAFVETAIASLLRQAEPLQFKVVVMRHLTGFDTSRHVLGNIVVGRWGMDAGFFNDLEKSIANQQVFTLSKHNLLIDAQQAVSMWKAAGYDAHILVEHDEQL